MISLPPELWLLTPLLYAETHYRFPHFFSLLRKNEPEVIADAPHRIEPGNRVPVLILIKDAHRYPALLTQITIDVCDSKGVKQHKNHLEEPIQLNEKISWRIIHLDLSGLEGWAELDVVFSLECQGRSRTYHNDNHRTSSHKPLRVFLAKEKLPRFPDLALGDPHTHSHFTEDQVEFGIPFQPAITLAKAMGLSYYCATDHSYDLDDHADSFLTNDPDLAKWNMYQSEVDQVNSVTDDFAVVRGEEVSCRNSDGRNVHFLIMGQREFIHGSGDGAERWGHTRSEHSISEVLTIKQPSSPAYAAHAKEPVPFLQRMLLGRGCWTDPDLALESLTGLQIINGRLDESFWEGYLTWTRLLLEGKRLFAIAGNDAHGNFNRFRQIGVPFLAIKEQKDQIFGRMRTGLFLDAGVSEQSVLKALGTGSSILTDGPVVRMTAQGKQDAAAGIGATVEGQTIEIKVEAFSTPEFGEIETIKIVVGRIGEKSERTAYGFGGLQGQGYSLQKVLSLNLAGASYVRAEAWSSSSNLFDGQRHFCLTNPIWISA